MPFSVYLEKLMKRILILIVACLLLTSLFSCNQGDDDNVDIAEMPEVEVTYLEDAVKLPEYKGLTVTQKAGENQGSAIWRTVLEGSEITEYPGSFLSYYRSQTISKYKAIAKQAGLSYSELLSALDLTETNVENEAKELAKAELVAMLIIEKESIELTDDEKTRLFDRYAEKIAEELGKDVEYVKESLSNEVYDTMLRDKMIEFLITQNEFVTED